MFHPKGRPPPKKSPSLRAPMNDRFRPRHVPLHHVVGGPCAHLHRYQAVVPQVSYDPVRLGFDLMAAGVTLRLTRAVDRTLSAIDFVCLTAVTVARIQAEQERPPEIRDPRNGTRLLAT